MTSCRRPAARGWSPADWAVDARLPRDEPREAITALLGPLSKGRSFSSALPLGGAPALSRANDKKELPMFLPTLLSGLNRWLRYRDTVRQLSRLSDHELGDLGIHRGDIRAVARSSR